MLKEPKQVLVVGAAAAAVQPIVALLQGQSDVRVSARVTALRPLAEILSAAPTTDVVVVCCSDREIGDLEALAALDRAELDPAHRRAAGERELAATERRGRAVDTDLAAADRDVDRESVEQRGHAGTQLGRIGRVVQCMPQAMHILREQIIHARVFGKFNETKPVHMKVYPVLPACLLH